MKKVLVSLLSFIFLCWPAFADDIQSSEVSELKSQMQQMQQQFGEMQRNYNEMINELQARIDQLEDQKQVQAVPASEEKIDQLQARVDELEQNKQEPSGVAKILGSFNPDASVLGDFVYKATDLEGGEGDNNFNMREVELAFSANVDTYARGDFFIAIENEDGETEVALEEGYLTLLETPVDDLQGKFGKFRPAFGKANRSHLHNMAWVDYPLVIQNYFGEEGFSEAGASLNYLIPNPWDVYSELTLEAFNNGASVLGGGLENETLYLAHLKEFFELNDTLTAEWGGSYLFGLNENGDGAKTDVAGTDVTLKWKSDAPGSYQGLTWQTEALFSNKEAANDEADIDAEDGIFNTWGMYSSLEHRFADRWSMFTRYDMTQIPDDSGEQTQAYSGGLTFAQSEFAFWRFQLTHQNNTTGDDANIAWVQLDFGIGPHRAHQY